MIEAVRRCRPLLGTFVEIACDQADAIDAGFAAIARVHKRMSAHEPDSELSRINRDARFEPIEVSAETAAVIRRALHWSRVSNGAFDIVRAGARALADGRLPRHDWQVEPAADGDWTDVQLDGREVFLARAACLDLGGIAKGYAVDEAVRSVQHAGAEMGLINAGGDMRAFGRGGQPVTVVEPRSRAPRVALTLRREALATSAGLPSGAGLSFDHLTAIQSEWTSVSVRGSNACDADALTKIVWALGPASTPFLAGANAQGFAIRADGELDQLGEHRES